MEDSFVFAFGDYSTGCFTCDRIESVLAKRIDNHRSICLDRDTTWRHFFELHTIWEGETLDIAEGYLL